MIISSKFLLFTRKIKVHRIFFSFYIPKNVEWSLETFQKNFIDSKQFSLISLLYIKCSSSSNWVFVAFCALRNLCFVIFANWLVIFIKAKSCAANSLRKVKSENFLHTFTESVLLNLIMSSAKFARPHNLLLKWFHRR